eukprot:TRINITY_DN6245_c0_g2_i4.p1 TRINITY_DN6245_c0_g2~~TRINITY_DN6245_c0_g2_i4.p1  ORF type:complete len:720 (+),score=94.05 TRINITY_DN6245_c0_g2_i4:285-2162(+)
MPPQLQHNCSSNDDCDSGEHCEWDPLGGTFAGACVSSFYYANQNRAVLKPPLPPVADLLGFGLTGDRCFSHDHCQGLRSCLGLPLFSSERYNVTSCEYSDRPCVCSPPQFALCASSSDCAHKQEICATANFALRNTYSYRSVPEDRLMLLPPICLSPNLTRAKLVLPLSTNSSVLHDDPDSIATLRQYAPSDLDDHNSSQLIRLQPDMPPFSIPELSTFNALFTNDLANDFIAGILSLLIVSHLHNTFRGLIYGRSGLRYSGYSSFIIFSRLTSLRNLFRLFTLRELNQLPPQFQRRRQPPNRRIFNWLIALPPFLAALLLFSAEFITIIAGTNTRSEFYSDRNFDPIIAIADGTPRHRHTDAANPHCDDFFVPTRGLFENGKVLKCVTPFSGPSPSAFGGSNFLRFIVFYGSGQTLVQVTSQNRSSTSLQLCTSLRSNSGLKLTTMPFRPDMMGTAQRNTFLNRFVNAVNDELGYERVQEARRTWTVNEHLGARGQLEAMELGFRHKWNESIDTIARAVTNQLRSLDLVLNSTGPTWVYTKPYTFEQRNGLMAIVKPYRIPHGWLVLAAVLMTVIHIIVNSYVTHFDDVAYTVMKELMGEDCLMGPLADGGIRGRDVDLVDLLN